MEKVNLALSKSNDTLPDLIESLPEHAKMLQIIHDNLPEVARAISLFDKTQSQFMDTTLTVAHPTAIRNLRQMLAEMNRSIEALRSARLANLKKELKIKMKLRDAEKEEDVLQKEYLQLEAREISGEIDSSQGYISAATRQVTNYMIQYNSVLKERNLTNFNEIDFEEEEERYHILTAFSQALIAARSRGGIIDEGNHIYLFQLGINGIVAQKEVLEYLNNEKEMTDNGIEPPHSYTLEFLNRMGEKFKGCSTAFAKYKGMTGEVTTEATLKTGDMRRFYLEDTTQTTPQLTQTPITEGKDLENQSK